MKTYTSIATVILSLAVVATFPACGTPPGGNVNKLDPESVLPVAPAGVARGEGELIETKDLFHGKQIVIQVEATSGRVARDYQAQREVVLHSKPIREQGDFLVYDSIGEVHKRPDGLVYVKAVSAQSGQPDWFVSCVRWKPKWAPGHGCFLRGQSGNKHYEVMMKDTDLLIAEELNAFVLAHLN